MDGFKYLNVLISAKTHSKLRETSYRLGKPISEIVRNMIAEFLHSPSGKRGGVENDR